MFTLTLVAGYALVRPEARLRPGELTLGPSDHLMVEAGSNGMTGWVQPYNGNRWIHLKSVLHYVSQFVGWVYS